MIEKTFDTGTIKLNYAESSSEGPPLFLLHGLTVRWQAFKLMLPELEKFWHIYALDFRGHGKSDRSASYRLKDNVPDLKSFIENCIGEPPVIFGQSFGGMIGIMLAAAHPELVRAFIIGDSLISPDFIRDYSEANRETMVFWRDMARNGDVDDIIIQLKNQLIPATPKSKELVPAVKVFGENNPHFPFTAKCLSQVDPELLTAHIKRPGATFADYQPAKLFPSIQCPVLLMQANPELGALMRDIDVESALKALPNAQHVQISKAGHFLQFNDKEAVLAAIANFGQGLDLGYRK